MTTTTKYKKFIPEVKKGPRGFPGGTGPPGAGTDYHNLLNNLDFASSGHTGFLGSDNNLSDVQDPELARGHLNVYSKSEGDGRYVELAGDTMTGELRFPSVSSHGIIANAQSGTWARDIVRYRNNANDAVLATLGALGTDDSLTYLYLGMNSWDGDNLRVYPDGQVMVGDATSATRAVNRQTGDGRWGQLAAPNEWSDNNMHKIQGDSYIEIPYSAGNDGMFLRGYDGAESQAFVLRTYELNDIQFNLDKGGIDVAGKGIYSKEIKLTGGYREHIKLDRYSGNHLWDITQSVDGGAGKSLRTVYNGDDVHYFLHDGGFEARGNVRHPDFTTGWQGTNYRITPGGDGEFENVKIRGGLQVWELILNQLRFQDGGLIIGSGGGKVAEVDDSTAGSEKLYFEDPEGNNYVPFTPGHIIMMQVFDVNSINVVKRVVRQVSAITGMRVDLTTTTGWTTGDDTPSTGSRFAESDVVVGIGHVSDPNLQNLIYMSAVDSGAPFTRYFSGVDSWAKFKLDNQEALRIQEGNLDTVVDTDFPVSDRPEGYGLYCDNIFAKGKIIVTGGDAMKQPGWDDADLECYWRFDEGSGTTAKDEQGNVNGTLEGDVSYVPGISGTGLEFDGGKLNLGEGNVAALLDGASGITFCTRIKVDDYPSEWAVIFLDVITASTTGLSVRMNSEGYLIITGRSVTADSHQSWTSGVKLLKDEWYYLEVVWDFRSWAQKFEIRINGKLAEQDFGQDWGETEYTVASPGQNCTIGNIYTGARPFEGILDETMIFSRRLAYESGLFNLFSHGDATRTTIQGGVITSGRIILQDENDVQQAGITGGGEGSDAAIWVGDTYANRNIAPIRLSYDGKLTSEAGNHKAELSGIDQQLAFSHQDTKRTILRADGITPLSTLISESVPETHTYTLDETYSGSGSFEEFTPSFTTTKEGVVDCTFRYAYTKHADATAVICTISGTVYLTDGSDTVLHTLGTFHEMYIGDDGFEIVTPFYLGESLAEGTYKLKIAGTYEDSSEDGVGNPKHGNFYIGGGYASDRQFTLTPDSHMRTEVGNDGMCSFWGERAYLYINTSDEEYQLRLRGQFSIRNQEGGIFASIPSGTRGFAMSLPDDQQFFIGAKLVDMSFLPGTSPGPGKLYASGGYIRIG